MQLLMTTPSRKQASPLCRALNGTRFDEGEYTLVELPQLLDSWKADLKRYDTSLVQLQARKALLDTDADYVSSRQQSKRSADIAGFLRQHGAFMNTSVLDLDDVIQHGEDMLFRRADVIVRHGDMVDAVFVLTEGTVTRQEEQELGHCRRLDDLVIPGTMLLPGDLGSLDERAACSVVVTSSTCNVLKLHRSKLEELGLLGN